jgi:hypothetical protein
MWSGCDSSVVVRLPQQATRRHLKRRVTVPLSSLSVSGAVFLVSGATPMFRVM